MARCSHGIVALPVDSIDDVMPEIDGRELAQQVQRRPPRVQVLLMSGYTDDAVVRYGVETTQLAFIQKPFTPSALMQKVRAVLHPNGNAQSG